MSVPTKIDMIHAYRNLYRGLLHAVRFSKPARYYARDTLRDAFRTDPPSMYNQKRIDNTVEFIGYAAKEAGLEHKILRNLLLMKRMQRFAKKRLVLWRSRLRFSAHVVIDLLTQVRSSRRWESLRRLQWSILTWHWQCWTTAWRSAYDDWRKHENIIPQRYC